MTEKLEVTSKLTALYPNNHSDQLLHELAETYRVDQIFSYNPQGVIIHSSSGEYIGWTAPIGHPVYEFMNSDNQSFVGPIRPDTESGILYKYGYFKTQNGYFVQLGISAERIQEVIGPFERRPLLETMAEDEDAEEVCLLNEHFIIFESTNPLRLGRSISDDEIITSLQKSKQFSHIIELDGQSLFQTFIPVSHPDITAMSITFSLKDITEFQQNLTLYGTLVLLVIYALILALLISMLIKDRRLLDRAFLDSLTLLPNDQFLIEYLDKVAAHKEYYNSYLLLLECQNYLDLYTAHGFSTSNELIYTLSNKLQEIVLGQSESSHGQIFGHKLLNLINQDKKLFKYDENTFAIHVKNISEQEVVSWVSKLNTMFESGIELEGDMRFPVILKTGIVEITPDHKSEASSILREAMLALQHTKSTTRTFSLFNRTIAYQKEREETVIRELEQAIANQDSLALQFYYQPQIDIRAGSIIGFEALARFQSAAFGALSPIEFIPIAEEHHLIFALVPCNIKKLEQGIAA
jgi:GGDEF domain-containing protein